nr:hypothetical protein [Tanacetum cinerariifolium]
MHPPSGQDGKSRTLKTHTSSATPKGWTWNGYNRVEKTIRSRKKKTVEVQGVTGQDALRMKPPRIPHIGIEHRLKRVQTFGLIMAA